MARIKKRIGKNKIGKNGEIIKGKITYQAEIRIKGCKPVYETFDKKTDAQIWAGDIESKLKRGFRIKDNQAKKHTLAELIDRYIADILPERKKDQQKIKMQLLWWKEHLGEYLLSEISPSLIAQYRDKLFKEPINRKKSDKRSASTVLKYMCSLSIALKKAINEWEWLDTNPLDKVEKKRATRGRTRFLSDKEQENLLNICKDASNKHLYLLVVLALATGARRGEIMNLTWDNVKLDIETPMLYFMETKNGENRAVPLTAFGLDVMKEYSKVRNIKSNLVFARPGGEAVMDLRWQWEEAVKKAKLENFTFHDLRHTAASNLAMDGAGLIEIAEILGHKTMAMVQRYSHLTKKHTAKVLERMNNKQFAKHIEQVKNNA